MDNQKKLKSKKLNQGNQIKSIPKKSKVKRTKDKKLKLIDIKRIIFLFLVTLLITFLFCILIIVAWAKTEGGYRFFNQLARNKPIDSWQAKVYYGIYKKYPTLEEPVEEKNVPSQEPSYQDKEIIAQIDLTTDKNLYHSGENINLNLKINIHRAIDNVNLFIFGIKNRYDEYSVYEIKMVNLNKGENNLRYSLKLPYCNSCSGVKEGEYQIKIELIKNEILLGESDLNISLKQ